MRLAAAAASLVVLLCGSATAQTAAEVVCKVENDCLARLKDTAWRSGEELHLRLDNGQLKTLASNAAACESDDAEKCSRISLVKYRPTERMFIIFGQGYDDGDYRIISQRTGEIQKLDGLPYFSPSGRLIATVGYDMEGAHVGVWSIKGDRVTRVFRYEDSLLSEEWMVVGWTGENRVRLRAKDLGKPGTTYDTEMVRTTAAGWQLKRPWAKP